MLENFGSDSFKFRSIYIIGKRPRVLGKSMNEVLFRAPLFSQK